MLIWRCYIHHKKAQVWVETIIYTLIGLTIMGLLLAIAKPKIENMKDNALIEQAIESLGKINLKIYEVIDAPGNRRTFDLKIGKGKFIIDGKKDMLDWGIESSFEYSETGTTILTGVINLTTQGKEPWLINLRIPYENYDIRFDNVSIIKTFEKSSNVYSFSVENLGQVEGKTILNFKEIN